MSIRPLVTLGDPRLRIKGEAVKRFDSELHLLLDDMTETMRDAPGVGLAAQQVGLALQACVIEIEGQLHELMNPRIVRLSGEQVDLEGCLSIPGYLAERKRAEKAVVEGRNRHGRRVRVSGTGLLARALQHEFDHLHGTLFIDGLEPGVELIHVSRLHEDDDSEPTAGGPAEMEVVATA